MRFIRLGTLSIEEVLPYIVTDSKPPHGHPNSNNRPTREYFGQLVLMDGLRCQTFAKSGIVCVNCKLAGAYFAVERREKSDQYQLNLYGLNGLREVLFTKDHIIPRVKGGAHDISNLQTMCSPCNNLKGHEADVDPSRNRNIGRIKRLQSKVNWQIGNINQQAKAAYQEGPGIKDGGPNYLALKARRHLLLNRSKKLSNLLENLKLKGQK